MRIDAAKHPVQAPDFEKQWDSQHVKFPCSLKNRYYHVSNLNQPLWKWQFICDQLKPVKTSLDLEKAIRSWNPTFASSWPPFVNLHRLSQTYHSFESSVLPYICQMALELPYLFKKPIPLLRRQKPGLVRLSQKQCVSLLANMFICTFPRRLPRHCSKKNEMVDFPSVSFEELFSRDEDANLAKLQCLCAYFEFHSKNRTIDKMVEFRRQVLTDDLIPNWSQCHAVLSPCTPAHTVLLEQVAGHWQADFANKVIGGGVLGSGAVQEEIRFSISPECLISRLLCQTLDDNEAVLISGSQQYAQYSGYGRNFKFTGPHVDWEVMKHNMVNQIIAFDALSYSGDHSDPLKQFTPKDTKRELEKSFAAFSVCEEDERSTAIATGRWGCGVFKGNPSWKILIQWIAASAAGREIVFCTLDDQKFFLSLYELSKAIQDRAPKTTVSDIYRIMSHWKPKSFDDDIFPFVMSKLMAPAKASHYHHRIR
jgi:poly(ADP-ribose) glycohydrolase